MSRDDQTLARNPRARPVGGVCRLLRDDLFGARAQRNSFRRYLEALLLPAERNKTLTALANAEPVAGAQHKGAQSLQWFLSESGWDPNTTNERRLALLLEDPKIAPTASGALIIDETGDRKETARRPPTWASSTSAASAR